MALRIAVLGSTGSIGTQTLDVARRHPEKVRVAALAAGRRRDELAAQAAEFGLADDAVALGADASGERQGETTGASGLSDRVLSLIHRDDVDMVVNALVGAAGLKASYETLAAGKRLALANKESLVVGGDLIGPMASEPGMLMPIDSEHGAIYQCLIGEEMPEVRRLWVTASGGPFRGMSASELKDIRPADALAHPTWKMGPKITIDSSTLMNKGLEVIEAHHLFGMPYDKIEVVVQPQSAIHSMVEFSDGSVKAHLGTTDMRIPIQYALSWPERWEAPVEPLDFRALGSLEFSAPDEENFPCLTLARHAGIVGGTLPAAMNAANEVAVAEFLAGRLPFLGIPAVIESVMESHVSEKVECIEQLVEVDALSRQKAEDAAAEYSS